MNLDLLMALRASTWTCPECEVTFTDPAEYAYGHDCEA